MDGSNDLGTVLLSSFLMMCFECDEIRVSADEFWDVGRHQPARFEFIKLWRYRLNFAFDFVVYAN